MSLEMAFLQAGCSDNKVRRGKITFQDFEFSYSAANIHQWLWLSIALLVMMMEKWKLTSQLVSIFSTMDSVLRSISCGCFDVSPFSTSFSSNVLKCQRQILVIACNCGSASADVLSFNWKSFHHCMQPPQIRPYNQHHNCKNMKKKNLICSVIYEKV